MDESEMAVTAEDVAAPGKRFSVVIDGNEVGQAFLYWFFGAKGHARPYAELKDVWVDELFRSQGIAGRLLDDVLATAKELDCYKFTATSRDDGTREEVHAWYRRRGLKDHGIEFRMDF
ncbi:MAG: GNAT family N-acetyltransferase [bacterium]|nr:GNAT family N-acetyltransferase [bacterium]